MELQSASHVVAQFVLEKRVFLRNKHPHHQAAVFLGNTFVVKVLGGTSESSNEVRMATSMASLQRRKLVPKTLVPIRLVQQVSDIDIFHSLNRFSPPFYCIFMDKLDPVQLDLPLKDLLSIMMELLATMAVMRKDHLFFWGDGIRSNVIVTKTIGQPLRTYSIAGQTWHTQSQYMPVLLDFEKSSLNDPNHTNHRVSDVTSIIRVIMDLATEWAGDMDPTREPHKWPHPHIAKSLRRMHNESFERYAFCPSDSSSNWVPFRDFLTDYPVLFDAFLEEDEQDNDDNDTLSPVKKPRCIACGVAGPAWKCQARGQPFCNEQCWHMYRVGRQLERCSI